jgi:serine/threonine protein phosphatase PrpC
VGVLPDVDVDRIGPEGLEDGDTFLLCSDGVDLVTEDRLLSAVRQHAPQDACDRILQWVADEGGRDDSTVVVAVIRV